MDGDDDDGADCDGGGVDVDDGLEWNRLLGTDDDDDEDDRDSDKGVREGEEEEEEVAVEG